MWKIPQVYKTLHALRVHWGSLSHASIMADYASSILSAAAISREGGQIAVESAIPEEGSDIEFSQRKYAVDRLQHGQVHINEDEQPFGYKDESILVNYPPLEYQLLLRRGAGIKELNLPPPGVSSHPLVYASEVDQFIQSGGKLTQEQIDDPMRHPILWINGRARIQLIGENQGTLSPVDSLYMFWQAGRLFEPWALAGMIK